MRPEELAPDAPARRVFSLPDTVTAQEGDVHVPPSLVFGIRDRQERMLFEHLPLLSADMNTRHEMTATSNASSGGAGAIGHNQKSVVAMSAHHETQLAAGTVQANVLARLVDLRNANAAGIALRIGGGSSGLFRNLEDRTIRGGLRCKVRWSCVCTLLSPSDFFFEMCFPSCVIDPSSMQCMEPHSRI